MAVTQVNGVTINKLTLEKYRELKASSQLVNNESYIISDIDEQVPTYKESVDTNNPIILRNLDSGIYKIYGYFKYYSGYSGISAVDPFAYLIVEKGSSFSYVTVISSNDVKKYKITNSAYEDLDDSGWINSTLESSFIPYGNVASNKPQYRKVGNLVEIRGGISPSSEIVGSSTGIKIFTLPAGFRPSKNVYEICQGSDRNVWLLTINTSGEVLFSRYGTTSSTTAGTGTWLVLNKTFMIG